MVPAAQTPRFRSVLDGFAPYKPGRVPSSPDGKSFKLSSNESPFGPLPSVRDVIAAAAGEVHRYPDNGAQALTEAISARFGVPQAHIAVGCGSVGVTQQLLEVTAMADAITERTRIVFVCNPNNPTGTVVRRAELEKFLDAVPADCLVVLDEAYREYVRDPGVPDGLSLYPGRPNLAVLRTFSKAYGLAGLRVGFMVAAEPVAAAVRMTMLPFTVNHIAQAAAIASLAAESELLDRVDAVVGERARVRGALLGDGWTVPPTEANFVWLRLGQDTGHFAAECAAAGISVRPFGDEGARVSIGDPEANEAFLAIAKAYPRRH
jgi:histidinol-phosphate aminotransferase